MATWKTGVERAGIPPGVVNSSAGAGHAACMTTFGLATPVHWGMAGPGEGGRGAARGLDGHGPRDLVDEVKARNLDAASETEVFRGVAAIVSRPASSGMSRG